MFHALIALLIQACVALLTGSWFTGAVAGVWFYIGRELAQAEYRAIQAFYKGKRAGMPWYEGARPRNWNRKALLDVAYPAGGVLVLAVVGEMLWHR